MPGTSATCAAPRESAGASVWKIIVPFPPSTNSYWRRVGPRVLVSKAGRLYRERVAEYVLRAGRDGVPPIPHRLEVVLIAPDARRRDIDNHAGKALLDALYGALGIDDSAVVSLHAEWRKDGISRAEVTLLPAQWTPEGRVTW